MRSKSLRNKCEIKATMTVKVRQILQDAQKHLLANFLIKLHKVSLIY